MGVTSISDASHKKERHIQLGGTRRRIRTDHHGMLLQLQEDLGYSSLEALLFVTSLIGARLLLSGGISTLISGEKRSGL